MAEQRLFTACPLAVSTFFGPVRAGGARVNVHRNAPLSLSLSYNEAFNRQSFYARVIFIYFHYMPGGFLVRVFAMGTRGDDTQSARRTAPHLNGAGFRIFSRDIGDRVFFALVGSAGYRRVRSFMFSVTSADRCRVRVSVRCAGSVRRISRVGPPYFIFHVERASFGHRQKGANSMRVLSDASSDCGDIRRRGRSHPVKSAFLAFASHPLEARIPRHSASHKRVARVLVSVLVRAGQSKRG